MKSQMFALFLAFVLGGMAVLALGGAYRAYEAGKAESEQVPPSVVLIHQSSDSLSVQYCVEDRQLIADENDIIVVSAGDASILRHEDLGGYTVRISSIRLIEGDAARLHKGDSVFLKPAVGGKSTLGIRTL